MSLKEKAAQVDVRFLPRNTEAHKGNVAGKTNDAKVVHAIVLHASRCTNNCVFCGSKDFGNIDENVAAEVQRLYKSLDQGHRVDEVEISGNDPAEFPGLPEMVTQINRALGHKPIKLASHGKVFADRTYVEQLISSGVTEFIFPFYGHTSNVHDAVTRVPGSFVETVRGLTNVVTSGARFSITCLITRENQPHIQPMLMFLAGIAEEISVGVPYLGLPTFRGSVPDLATLKGQLSNAIQAVGAQERCLIRLRNIPRCLVEFEYPLVEDSQDPPVGAYEHWRRDEILKAGFVEIVDGKVLPRYRKFSKCPECQRCRYDAQCPGFLTTYIDLGLFHPQPIT